MGKRLIALVALVLSAVGRGEAATIELIARGPDQIIAFDGPIQRTDAKRMAQLLSDAARVREVVFNSRGGSLEAGIDIGEGIRARRVATRVPAGAVCASACVYAFLGGIIRTVDPDARVGIHMASGAFNDTYVEAVKRVLLDPAGGDVDAKVRTIILLNEQFSAIAARRQARYLTEMGVSLRLLDPGFDTPHLDIYWLSPAELRDYNVVN